MYRCKLFHIKLYVMLAFDFRNQKLLRYLHASTRQYTPVTTLAASSEYVKYISWIKCWMWGLYICQNN